MLIHKIGVEAEEKLEATLEVETVMELAPLMTFLLLKIIILITQHFPQECDLSK